ncbi:MAG: type I restriction-modification system subunit M N-terminal domain-containing protein [Christensenellaceae bacterium]|nr:type I restriction-modification system subunit M N-terminal domain-containing protein [Christensenellaceae bacterium]
MRASVEPAEYKHVALSLFFLKFANFKFDKRRQDLIDEGKAKFVDIDSFYTMENIFSLAESRWSYILQNAKQPNIALLITGCS